MNNGFISEEFASLKQRLSNINGVVSLREIPRKRKTKTRQRTLTSHSDQNMINNVVLIIQRLVFEVLKERSSNIRQFQKNRHRRGINPVSKIDKAVCRNVFLTIWHHNLSTKLTKTHSFRLFFLAILPNGK